MKQEVRLLRKAQKVLSDMQYPGYPYQLSIVIDLEAKCAWVDYEGQKQPLEKALREIAPSLLYQCLWADKTNKKTFIIDQHLEDYKQYLKYDYEQFGIDNYDCCKFFFALNAAIYNHKKTDKGFIFACIDEDTEYVDVQVFNDLASIEKYIDEYFTEHEEDLIYGQTV